MTTLRRLPKPTWASEKGCILDGAYIPHAHRTSLHGLLDRRWDATSKTAYLDTLDHLVQMVFESRPNQSLAEQKKILNDVESAAHSLLVALRKLDGDAKRNLDANSSYLARIYGGNPSVKLSPRTAQLWDGDSALSAWWDVVQDIELATAYAGGKIKPDKGNRITQANARALVVAAASAVYESIGKLPASSKGTWFPPFAKHLCEIFTIKQCDVALVDKVVKKMKLDPLYAA